MTDYRLRVTVFCWTLAALLMVVWLLSAWGGG